MGCEIKRTVTFTVYMGGKLACVVELIAIAIAIASALRYLVVC